MGSAILLRLLRLMLRPAPPARVHRSAAVVRIETRQTTVVTSAPPPRPAPRVLTGRAHVIDGDTIVIGRTKIRIAGIDAPELDMPYGQKAKWAMVHLVKGQTVSAHLTGETSYDREVAHCYLPDGRDLGAELVKQGLALDFTYFSKGKYRHLEPPGARRRLWGCGHFGRPSEQSQRS